MKRRWFQIHLSTAIVMMIATGALMMTNLIPKTDYKDSNGAVELYGWPFNAFLVVRGEVPDDVLDVRLQSPWIMIVGNLMVTLMCLGSVFVVSQYLIRRRERGRA